MKYWVKLFSFFIILFIFEMHFKLIQNWLPFKTNELKQWSLRANWFFSTQKMFIFNLRDFYTSYCLQHLFCFSNSYFNVKGTNSNIHKVLGLFPNRHITINSNWLIVVDMKVFEMKKVKYIILKWFKSNIIARIDLWC